MQRLFRPGYIDIREDSEEAKLWQIPKKLHLPMLQRYIAELQAAPRPLFTEKLDSRVTEDDVQVYVGAAYPICEAAELDDATSYLEIAYAADALMYDSERIPRADLPNKWFDGKKLTPLAINALLNEDNRETLDILVYDTEQGRDRPTIRHKLCFEFRKGVLINLHVTLQNFEKPRYGGYLRFLGTISDMYNGFLYLPLELLRRHRHGADEVFKEVLKKLVPSIRRKMSLSA